MRLPWAPRRAPGRAGAAAHAGHGQPLGSLLRFFGVYTRGGVAGSCGYSVFNFSEGLLSILHVPVITHTQLPLGRSARVSSSHLKVTMSKTKRRLCQCPQLLAAWARTAAASDPAAGRSWKLHLRTEPEATPSSPPLNRHWAAPPTPPKGLPCVPTVWCPCSGYGGQPGRPTPLIQVSDDCSSRLEKGPRARWGGSVA